jgi:hypothetical protein
MMAPWIRVVVVWLLAVPVILGLGHALIPWRLPLGMGVWLMGLIVFALLMLRWEAVWTVWECAACGNQFRAPLWKLLISLKWFRQRRLRCPSCSTVSWCTQRRKLERSPRD